MFERYTETARRVIFFARYEASQLATGAIEVEHLLLGLMREGGNLINRFFPNLGADIESARSKVAASLGARERISVAIDLPLSAAAKQALAFADEESKALGHRQIGPDHLLLGLLREGNSTGAGIISESGLQLDEVRRELINVPPINPSAARQPVTQRLRPDETQPSDRDERWLSEVSTVCFDLGLFTRDELATEFERVTTLRHFRSDVEALLRLLATKGLVEAQNLPGLAVDLRDEKRLAEFVEKLQQRLE